MKYRPRPLRALQCDWRHWPYWPMNSCPLLLCEHVMYIGRRAAYITMALLSLFNELDDGHDNHSLTPKHILAKTIIRSRSNTLKLVIIAYMHGLISVLRPVKTAPYIPSMRCQYSSCNNVSFIAMEACTCRTVYRI